MIAITTWMEHFLTALHKTFGDRISFIGLQGSYARGEASDTSDIDVVVILDSVSAADLKYYRAMLDPLPHRDRICGFFSGKQELLNWEPSDLFQFYYDTIPVEGSLDDLLERITPNAVDRAVKIGACNIYHACVHNMLHEKNEELLKGLYKSATFTIQAICFRQTGCYVRHLTELLDKVSLEEQNIIRTYLAVKNGQNVTFFDDSEQLFLWAKKWITEDYKK